MIRWKTEIDRDNRGIKEMLKENTLISITREYGSGGKEIAEILANKMGTKCYDRQIIYLAAEKMGDSSLNMEDLLEECNTPKEHFWSVFGLDGVQENIRLSQVFIKQSVVIRELAEKGSAVFLGRCADAVLKDYPEHYAFFIYADDSYKKERMEKYYDKKSLKELKKVDRERKDFYKRYTGQEWGNPENYNLMIDAGKCGVEEAAELIYRYIEMQQK